MSNYPKVGLPEKVTITDVRGNAEVAARLIRLSRETAKDRIDLDWWEVEDVPPQRLRQEVDYEWKWKVLVSKYQNNPFTRCVCSRWRVALSRGQ